MRLIMPLVCSGGWAAICRFGQFWGGKRCSRCAPKGGSRAAPTTRGWFLTLNGVALDKLPWFAMVLLTFGGCSALDNASCVYLRTGGNMQFWSILEQKSLFIPSAKGRAPGRSHDTRAVPNPLRHRPGQTPMVCHGSTDVLMMFCAP